MANTQSRLAYAKGQELMKHFQAGLVEEKRVKKIGVDINRGK